MAFLPCCIISKTWNLLFLKFFYFFLGDSGRFSIQGSSKSHTARLASGERIFRRYEADPSTLEVINESTLLFKIQSMSLPTQWYHASMQSSYCDCPDWTSDCKHLYGIRLIIQHHFPHLYAVLPIVDNAHALGLMWHNIDADGNDQGTSEGPNINVGGNDEGGILNTDDGLQIEHTEASGIDEQIHMCIQDFKNLLQDLQEGFSVYDSTQKEAILQQLRVSKETVAAMVVPANIDLPLRGSIRQIQAHVTLTRLGHGQPREAQTTLDEEIIDSLQPPKRGRFTRVLRRKQQRGRSRVRFEKRARIMCPHCCSKTLMIDPLHTHTCHTCHVLLPLSRRHAPLGSENPLINKVVSLCDNLPVKKGVITSCSYGLQEDEEREFSLCLQNGILLEKIRASQLRIMLVYTA